MAHFINSKETAVQQALDGCVAASGGGLVRLDGYPFIKVIVRADWDRSRVAVISGGGIGSRTCSCRVRRRRYADRRRLR